MILDILTGGKSLRKIRNRATDFANRMYDPSVYNPQADVFRRQAGQGIEENTIREDFLAQLFRQQPQLSAFGGNQAAAIAGSQVTDMNRSQAMGDFERNLATQELQAMERGRMGLAGVQTQQLQTEAQRKAAIAEAEMEYEAERSSRRQALLGQAINLGALGMTGAFKPGMDAIKGTGLRLFNDIKGYTSAGNFDINKALEEISQFNPNIGRSRVRQQALTWTANSGGTVPGPDVDEDVVPAILTPGEEVINAESAEASRDLLKMINENPDMAAQIEEFLMSMGVQSSNDGGTVAPSKKVVQGRFKDQLQRMLDEPDFQTRMMDEYSSGRAALNMANRTADAAERLDMTQFMKAGEYTAPVQNATPATQSPTAPPPAPAIATPQEAVSVMDLPEVEPITDLGFDEYGDMTEEDLMYMMYAQGAGGEGLPPIPENAYDPNRNLWEAIKSGAPRPSDFPNLPDTLIRDPLQWLKTQFRGEGWEQEQAELRRQWNQRTRNQQLIAK